MRDSVQLRGFERVASLRVLSGFAWPCDPGATPSTSAAVDLEREHAGAGERSQHHAGRCSYTRAMDFEDIKAAFWNEAVDFDVQVPLTDAMVAHAEETLGVKLPDSYLALLRIQNGGYTSDAFKAHPAPEPTSWARDHVPFDSMFGIGANGEGVLQSPALLGEWGMPDGLVLLTGDGHWWIALDYRLSGPAGPPSVVWFDNEVGEDIQLARDFRTFIRALRSEEEFDSEEVDLQPGQVRSAWIDPDLLK